MIKLDQSPAGTSQAEHVPSRRAELAAAVRELMEAQLLTDVDDTVATEVAAELAVLTKRLRAAQVPAPIHDARNSGTARDVRFNAVIGRLNPVAPPVAITRHTDGTSGAEVTLGAVYQGPIGLVHGGVLTMLLDQVLGAAATGAGRAGLTAELTSTFRRKTPLGRVTVNAEVVAVEGRRTTVHGRLRDAEGNICVEAEALFISPREWSTA